MDYKYESGKRLTAARERAGFKTQTALAKHMGWGPSRISNYENAIKGIEPHVARELSAVLSCSAAWLLCLDDETLLKNDEKVLIDNYRATDKRGKTIISRVAESESPYSIKGDITKAG